MKYLFFAVLISCYLMQSCANIVAPNGGPKDTIAPKIMYSEPISGSINFRENSVQIAFDKYMDKSKVNDNVFISPYQKLKYSWSGKTLEIIFTEELKENLTYALSIGTDLPDIKGNKPSQSYTLIFSTGSKIDSASIKGKVYSDVTAGWYVFAYRTDNDRGKDSNNKNIEIDPTKIKPDYKTQLGSNGNFEIKALKAGKYRLFLVDDKFKDDLYNVGSDMFATAPYEVNLAENSKVEINIKGAIQVDESKPYLSNAEALTNRKLLLSFSEDIDSSSIRASSFRLKDSTGKELAIKNAYPNSKANQAIVLLEKELESKMKYIFSIKSSNELKENALKDKAGNTSLDSLLSLQFYSNDEKDSMTFFVNSLPFKDSSQNIDFTNGAMFQFELPFDQSVAQSNNAISLVNMKDNSIVPASIDFVAANKFRIKAKNPLAFQSWYAINVNFSKVKGEYRLAKDTKQDSILKLRFKTADEKGYSIIQGSLSDSTMYKGNYLINLISKEKKKNYQTTLSSPGKWTIKDVEPGTYSLEVWMDENANGKYDFGYHYPYQNAEKFYVIPGEINAKAKWDIEDVIIKLK